MSPRRRWLVAAGAGLPLGLVALALVAAGWSCRAVEVGLVDGRLRPCPPSPNCVCSEDPAESGSAIEPLSFSGDPDEALRSLVDYLSERPRVTVETVEGDYVHAVFRTALLRFRDDVELLLDREAGVIHVRSASRVGYSDLGANRARVESIRTGWRPPEESPAADPGSAVREDP